MHYCDHAIEEVFSRADGTRKQPMACRASQTRGAEGAQHTGCTAGPALRRASPVRQTFAAWLSYGTAQFCIVLLSV